METKEVKPVRKDRFDWRDGLCNACGVEATNGCCPRHKMQCESCNGYGATTKEAWNKLYEFYRELRNNPPSECCKECDSHFNHGVGSHGDYRDDTPCLCLKGKCNFPMCMCHSNPIE